MCVVRSCAKGISDVVSCGGELRRLLQDDGARLAAWQEHSVWPELEIETEVGRGVYDFLQYVCVCLGCRGNEEDRERDEANHQCFFAAGLCCCFGNSLLLGYRTWRIS